MKRIMILGAGRGQVGLIKAANDYGYHSIVASIDGDYPGFKYASEKCIVDISNSEAVLHAAQDMHIDGVATACLDTGIGTLGYVCDSLGLSGLSLKSAQCCNDKLRMKDAFISHGVSTARFKYVRTLMDLREAVSDLGMPIIIKAVDLQGSRGINIVKNDGMLEEAFHNTMKETKLDYCIVEQFIEGEEFGAQAFINNGELVYFLPCGDITFWARTNIPVGHYAPLELNSEDYIAVKDQVLLACNAVGLDNCAVNVDLIKSDGKFYIIELTGRIGANCLPEIVSTYYGIDVYKMILDVSLGLDVREWFNQNKKQPVACYAKILFSNKSGILKSIRNQNKNNTNILDISFYVKEGQKINTFTNSKDCIGQIIVKGETLQECEALIDDVSSNIIIDIEGGLNGKLYS